MSEKFAFIAGTVLLDIVSTITDNRHPNDALGTTTLNFGGVAYNVAVNLRSMGIPVTLMTALNDSPISQMLKNELESNHVRLHLQNEPTIADGIYSGHFHQGEEIASIWSNVLENVTFPKAFIKRAMRNASCAIITNCLNLKSIHNCIEVAQELNVPLFLSGASLMESAKFAKIKGKVDLLFANEAEIDVFKQSSHIEDPAELAKMLDTSLVMTRGDKGVRIYNPAGQQQQFDIEAKEVVQNSLGAGDLFMAATVKKHFFEKMPLLESIESSLKTAAAILERDDANIGRKRALEANIAHISLQAEKDKLTGLLNRHGIERFMKNRNLANKPFHVILFDVDHFKKFNDTYGHDKGDEVLTSVASVIGDAIRSKDAVGRWGGEEFICIVDDKNTQVAKTIAERVRTRVEAIHIKDVDSPLTISAGVGFSPKDASNWEVALKKADDGLYQAKDNGRNQVVVNT